MSFIDNYKKRKAEEDPIFQLKIDILESEWGRKLTPRERAERVKSYYQEKREYERQRRRKRHEQEFLKEQVDRLERQELGLDEPEAHRDEPLQGLKEIAKCAGWSHNTTRKRSKELQKANVAWKEKKGRPPDRRIVIKAYPSELKEYVKARAQKNP